MGAAGARLAVGAAATPAACMYGRMQPRLGIRARTPHGLVLRPRRTHTSTAGDGVQGEEEGFDLEVVSGAVPSSIMNRFPHLFGCTVLRVPAAAADRVAELVPGQLLVSARDAAGVALDGTGVQVGWRGPIHPCAHAGM